ncbi:hypothetical protein [Herbaspirillum sp. alder98]|uniref:hypothetical protein n=1 Tax=Herbaspirillum sp. alder98 TaxID=2913096 RepID=UPI001CD8DE05|nr:hypothetical protein [Herbaspirillum sp. alder98]MCA1325572.1 hypothetical protein [Herbaspirillum sp. alder98]
MPTSDLASGWGSTSSSFNPRRQEVDPYDIGEYSPSQSNRSDDQSYAQTPNDTQALKDFGSMLMAILAQLLNWNSPSSTPSDQQAPTSPGQGYDRSDIDGGVDGGFTPPSFVEKTPVTDTGTDDPGQSQQNPDEAQGTPTNNNPVSSPQGTQLVSTGTGNGHFFNVTNNTDREQTFAFSSNSSNTSGYSNKIDALMTLKPGETGTFEAGDDVPGIRINTSGPNGETNGNETLYEDTIQTNPMGGGIVHNPDVSNVAGKLSYDGRPQLITVSDGTRTIGDGTETGVYDYDIEDQDPNRATNPMNMALNPASTYDIVFSDG